MDTERADNAEEPENPRGGTGDGGAHAESGAAARDEPPVRARDDTGDPDARPARRFSPVIVASVAAAVLAVGAGGVYLATAGSQGHRDIDHADPAGTGTPPPLALDDAAGGAAGAGSGSANGIAPGEPNPYGVTYRATGDLPGGPDTAPVYLARAGATRAQVVRLAAALGVTGAPVDEGGAWRVGTVADGTGTTLTVDKQAPGTWTFNRYTQGGDNCKGTTCKPGSPASSGRAPSEAEAKKAAAPVLKAEGQDDAKTDAGQVVDNRRVVNADPVVGGLPTYGWTTDLSVAAGGQVVSGSGRLTPLTKSATYPVLDADRTLDLLNGTAADTGRRMGPGGCATPVPLGERLETPCGQGSSGTGTPGPGGAPSASASTGETVPVKGAEFGLATRSVAGQPALVPAWLFQVTDPDGTNSSLGSDGSTVAYPAVDPQYLVPAAPSGTASGKPSAQGDGSGTTATVPADGYTASASGDRLTLSFTGGVCSTYTAAAKESGGRVTVTVTSHGHRGRVCVTLARFYERTVRLSAPLDGRSVVNADGTPVPEGTGQPAPTEGAGGAGQETMHPMQPR
ncbi:hypothetical protein [Streptomyces sp. NPDC008150]|uniref:hypothetical protein n=1 Tax=Streptomyces sp. NPDC008150 TaxID=3364816 RepID=UPI0036E6D110